MNVNCFVAFTIFPLFSLASISELPENELVERAAAGNTAALQAIESYYCNVLYTTSALERNETSIADYWRTKDVVRIRVKKSSTMTDDVRIDGGKSQLVSTVSDRLPDPNEIGATFDESRRFVTVWDAWQLSLFDLPATVTRKPPLFIYNLAELIAKGTIKEAGWDQLDGNKVVHLSIDLGEERRGYDLWVDPKRNWLVTKAIHSLRETDGTELWKIEHVIKEMREIQPSISVPISTSISLRLKGKSVQEQFIRFDGIRVNEPNSAIPPMPTFSGGSLVADLAEGTLYRIDGTGRRSSNIYRIGADISGLADPPAGPTKPNSSRIWGWILGVTAIILFACALALGRRVIRN